MQSTLSYEDLLDTRFRTRKDAFSALRVHEYTVNRASLKSISELSSGEKAVYCCASPSCTLQYTVRLSMKDGGYWYIDGGIGMHNLCLPTKKRALCLPDVMLLSPVAAQLAIQNNRLEPSQVSPDSITQAAKECKIDLSKADLSRIQALNTARLTDIALDGYDKVAWYCHEVVRLNPIKCKLCLEAKEAKRLSWRGMVALRDGMYLCVNLV
jgi:hypothetical protein